MKYFMKCPNHGGSNHELTQLFYDGLALQDRYILDATSGGSFMNKFKDGAMKLIKTVAENSHHNVANHLEEVPCDNMLFIHEIT